MIKKEELLKEIKRKKVYTDLVEKAYKQACTSHKGQKRDDGTFTLENHIFPIVYSILNKYENKDFLEDLVVLALLHDTMEDDDNFDRDSCVATFNEEICENVRKLTKDEKTIRSYSGNNKGLYELLKYFRNKEYINNVNGSNEICKIVKLEDRINNLQTLPVMGSDCQSLRYVMESDTLFIDLAKSTKSFDYLPLLRKEIERLST